VTGTVDPEIAAFNAALTAAWRAHPPLGSVSVPEARTIGEIVREPWRRGGPEMADTRELTVRTAAGPLRLRVHHPAGLAPGPAPALLYLHGGGFVLFSIDTHDRLMREYAAAGGFIVIGIDYPLSPEAKFPLALDRVSALVSEIAIHAAALGIDPARVAIGGDSAGANLALGAAVRQRDAGTHMPLRAILSNYGAFSDEVSDAAEAAYGGADAVLNREEMAWFFAQYLDAPDDARDPLACPLLLDDLAGLPPVFLAVAEHDVLAEQSITLAERLTAADVAVTTQVYAGATHSFLEAMSVSDLARQAIRDGADWLAARLA
jgi:acetyl esterase